MRKLILFILTISLCFSCAKQVNKATSSSQPLTPKAQKIYTFLKFWRLEEKGLFEEAKKQADKLLSLAPCPYVYLEVANFYWRNLKFEKARNILKQGIQKWPKEKNLYLSLAKSYLAEKRFQSAQTTLETYLQLCPKDYSIYPEIAAIYIETENYTKVIDLLQKLPASQHTKITLYYLGRANFELGMALKAENYLKKALKKDENFFQAWAELAYIYESTKRYAEAEEVYSKLLQEENNNEQLILRLIKLNLKLNNSKRALNFIKKYNLSLDNKLNAVLDFIDYKYYNIANKLLDDIVKQNGYSDRIYFFYALLYYEKDKNIDKSIYWLNKIDKKSKYYNRALKFKIQMLLDSNKIKKAKEILSKALSFFPKDKEFVILEINLFEQTNQYKTALKKINKYLQIWPKEKELLYRKALILEHLKKREQALRLMQKVISLYPDYDPALNFVGYILAEEGKDLDRAKVLIEEALKLDPENGYYLDSLAWVYFKQQKYQKAWKIIQQAVDKVKDDPTIWEHYGDIAFNLRLFNKAKQGYLKALKLKPNNLKLKQKLKQLK
ncbi:tetratricopeptide repeat protein [Desulfonauticus submarinus]